MIELKNILDSLNIYYEIISPNEIKIPAITVRTSDPEVSQEKIFSDNDTVTIDDEGIIHIQKIGNNYDICVAVE